VQVLPEPSSAIEKLWRTSLSDTTAGGLVGGLLYLISYQGVPRRENTNTGGPLGDEAQALGQAEQGQFACRLFRGLRQTHLAPVLAQSTACWQSIVAKRACQGRTHGQDDDVF
jgi:hypothetical protein